MAMVVILEKACNYHETDMSWETVEKVLLKITIFSHI
jgi:hypothetical protein